MTDNSPTYSGTTRKRGVGRPRRLTLDQILNAALELGLDDLTMTQLAQRLGVSVTVLYGYVRNREDLVKAALARATLEHEFPDDSGQHWSDYMAGHAGALHDMLTLNSQLISAFMQGGLGPHSQVERAEAWLAALGRRGFPPAQAADLHRAVGQLVIGCAVARLHAHALEASGRSYREEMQLAVRARAAGALPLHQRYLTSLISPHYGNWEGPLYWLMLGVAAERKEDVPTDSWLGIKRRKAALATNR